MPERPSSGRSPSASSGSASSGRRSKDRTVNGDFASDSRVIVGR
jgi:hypothetical protein